MKCLNCKKECLYFSVVFGNCEYCNQNKKKGDDKDGNV